MGNRWSKLRCLRTTLSGNESDRAHRVDAASATRCDPVPGPGGPSSEPTGQEPCRDNASKPFISDSQRQNLSDSSRSNSTPTRKVTQKEVQNLTKCLDYVEEVINEYRAIPLTFSEKLEQIGQNLSADSPIQSIINQGSRFLDMLAKKCAKKAESGGVVLSTVQEAKTLVKTTLTALEKVDQFVPGVAVIAFTASQIYDRLRVMDGNKKDILKILEGLVKLCRHLLKLHLHTAFEQVQEAMSLICMTEMWCDKYSRNLARRFMFVNITRENIEKLQEGV